MINPCVSCRAEGLKEIPYKVLKENLNNYFKVTLPNGKQIFVCSYHLDKTDLKRVLRIEKAGLTFSHSLNRTKR